MAFLLSILGMFDWCSPGTTYNLGIRPGTFEVSWRPPGWRIENGQSPGQSGWGMLGSREWPELKWWVSRQRSTYWETLAVPLWMPFIFLASLTGILWYNDRRYVASNFRRMALWTTHKCRKQLTLRLVVTVACLHAILSACLEQWVGSVYAFFVAEYPPGDSVSGMIYAAGTIALVTTPFWAFFWAWIWIGIIRRLERLRPPNQCQHCGYDLTGLPEPRCSECGTPFTLHQAC